MDTEGYVTVPEAARLLGIKRDSIYQAIRANRLPAICVLGRLAIRRADVDAYQPRAYKGRPGRRVGGRQKGKRREES